jgi:hypothetical protein
MAQRALKLCVKSQCIDMIRDLVKDFLAVSLVSWATFVAQLVSA